MLYFTYLWSLLKLFIFATNMGRYWLELSVADLPGRCQTRGYSCNPQTQSCQNWLDEDGLKIRVVAPKRVRHYTHFSHILPLCRQPNHTSWSMDPSQRIRSRQVMTEEISSSLQPPWHRSVLPMAQAQTDQGYTSYGEIGHNSMGSRMS